MQYRISSPFRRLGAFIIETFLNVLILVILPISLIEPLGDAAVYAVIGIGVGYISLVLYLFSRGTTLGKAVLHMRVVDMDTWEPIGFRRMLFRETVGKLVSFVGLNLGFIWILIDKNAQGWHDKITRCYVVDKDVLVQGSVHVKDYNPYIRG